MYGNRYQRSGSLAAAVSNVGDVEGQYPSRTCVLDFSQRMYRSCLTGSSRIRISEGIAARRKELDSSVMNFLGGSDTITVDVSILPN